MALPRQPSARQEDIINYMMEASPRHVIGFLSSNRDAFDRFFKRYNNEFDFDAFIDTFKSGNRAAERACRDYMGACMDNFAHTIPEKGIKLPPALRDEYRRVARAKTQEEKKRRREQTRRDAQIEKEALKRTIASLRSGSPLMIPVRAAKGLTEAIAYTLSSVGLTKGKRIAAQFGFAAPFVVNAFLTAGVMTTNISDAHAALTPDKVRYSAPLEITIRPPKPDGSALAYASPKSHFDSIAGIIEKMMGKPEGKTATSTSPYYLSPYMLAKLKENPQSIQYLRMCSEAAIRKGLDPVLYCNQIFRESRHFNQDVIDGKVASSKGAYSIAQFLPSTAAEWGLSETELKTNPEKALDASTDMMLAKTKQFGDQVLALAAYNGGDRAVTWVQEELGKSKITGDEWIAFMEKQRRENPSKNRHAYQNETYKYVMDITNRGWDGPYLTWAQKMHHGDLPTELAFISRFTPAPADKDRGIGNQLSLGEGGTRDIPTPTRAPREPANG